MAILPTTLNGTTRTVTNNLTRPATVRDLADTVSWIKQTGYNRVKQDGTADAQILSLSNGASGGGWNLAYQFVDLDNFGTNAVSLQLDTPFSTVGGWFEVNLADITLNGNRIFTTTNTIHTHDDIHGVRIYQNIISTTTGYTGLQRPIMNLPVNNNLFMEYYSGNSLAGTLSTATAGNEGAKFIQGGTDPNIAMHTFKLTADTPWINTVGGGTPRFAKNNSLIGKDAIIIQNAGRFTGNHEFNDPDSIATITATNPSTTAFIVMGISAPANSRVDWTMWDYTGANVVTNWSFFGLTNSLTNITFKSKPRVKVRNPKGDLLSGVSMSYFHYEPNFSGSSPTQKALVYNTYWSSGSDVTNTSGISSMSISPIAIARQGGTNNYSPGPNSTTRIDSSSVDVRVNVVGNWRSASISNYKYTPLLPSTTLITEKPELPAFDLLNDTIVSASIIGDVPTRARNLSDVYDIYKKLLVNTWDSRFNIPHNLFTKTSKTLTLSGSIILSGSSTATEATYVGNTLTIPCQSTLNDDGRLSTMEGSALNTVRFDGVNNNNAVRQGNNIDVFVNSPNTTAFKLLIRESTDTITSTPHYRSTTAKTSHAITLDMSKTYYIVTNQYGKKNFYGTITNGVLPTLLFNDYRYLNVGTELSNAGVNTIMTSTTFVYNQTTNTLTGTLSGFPTTTINISSIRDANIMNNRILGTDAGMDYWLFNAGLATELFDNRIQFDKGLWVLKFADNLGTPTTQLFFANSPYTSATLKYSGLLPKNNNGFSWDNANLDSNVSVVSNTAISDVFNSIDLKTIVTDIKTTITQNNTIVKDNQGKLVGLATGSIGTK